MVGKNETQQIHGNKVVGDFEIFNKKIVDVKNSGVNMYTNKGATRRYTDVNIHGIASIEQKEAYKLDGEKTVTGGLVLTLANGDRVEINFFAKGTEPNQVIVQPRGV